MTNPSSRNKPLTPDAARPVTPHHTWTQKQAAIPWRAVAAGEQLMPFGSAAKDIFVKANGLSAYCNSIGVPSYAPRKKD